MLLKESLKKFWNFLNEDSWLSWIVSIILIIIFIKFIFFPILSFLTGSSLPLVVVESCSMYHESNFEEWWNKNSEWYEDKDINKEEFKSFPFKNGLNKGDIILVLGKKNYEIGDIIIFTSSTKHPLIHRVVTKSPISTKGDHNANQLLIEKDIPKEAIIGKSAMKIPLLGWIKLVIFEPFRSTNEKGLCN